MTIEYNTPEDISSHKNYSQNYGKYLADIEEESVKQNIIQHFKPSICYDEYFTDEEIEWMQAFAFSRCSRLRINPNGTFFVSGNMQGVFEKFRDRFESLAPGCSNSPVVKGNYFITPEQYGLHNDSIHKKDWTVTFGEDGGWSKLPKNHPDRKWVPWRNIIVPLMVSPDVLSTITFMNQRHVSWFTVYNHGAENVVAADYPIITDYSEIEFHTKDGAQPIAHNTVPYDKTHWNTHLNYTPYERLTGLTEEHTFHWKPKCPMVFDCYQLHATNQGMQKPWKIKMGLLLCFFREVK